MSILKSIFRIPPAGRNQQNFVLALCVYAIAAVMAVSWDPAYAATLGGILLGFAWRASVFLPRLTRFGKAREVGIEAREAAAEAAANDDKNRLSVEQIDDLAVAASGAAARLTRIVPRAALAARLLAAAGGIVHLALSDRLLPAPRPAR